MKSVVVYYSLTGNTKLVSRMIADRIGADVIGLKPENEIPSYGCRKYLLGGKSVIFREKPKLLNDDLSLEGRDILIIGTPIWAGSFPPPINTLLSSHKIKDMDIFLFSTQSSGTSAKRCFSKMKKKLAGNRIKGTAEFEDVKKMSATELDDRVRRFCLNITGR